MTTSEQLVDEVVERFTGDEIDEVERLLFEFRSDLNNVLVAAGKVGLTLSQKNEKLGGGWALLCSLLLAEESRSFLQIGVGSDEG